MCVHVCVCVAQFACDYQLPLMDQHSTVLMRLHTPFVAYLSGVFAGLLAKADSCPKDPASLSLLFLPRTFSHTQKHVQVCMLS